jgi:secondary thiamine-phosphate synthase enzyme
MKSYRKELIFAFPEQHAVENITDKVSECVTASGVKEGLCLVNAMNVTASVYINDDDVGLKQDFEEWLDRLAPHDPENQHHLSNTGEKNADSHLKRTIMGREVVIAITHGKLDLGTWENVMFYDFDGRRKKEALVKIIGE